VTRKSAIAVMAAALAAAFASAGQAQQPPVHDAGMRIIHVPQGGAAVATYPDEVAIVEDEPASPKPRKRATPRRVLPPAGAKRTVLSAPADERALTPIRPTPRWRGIEKFSEPPRPITATAPVEPAPMSENIPPPAD
jgi:hypothetical protein